MKFFFDKSNPMPDIHHISDRFELRGMFLDEKTLIQFYREGIKIDDYSENVSESHKYKIWTSPRIDAAARFAFNPSDPKKDYKYVRPERFFYSILLQIDLRFLQPEKERGIVSQDIPPQALRFHVYNHRKNIFQEITSQIPLLIQSSDSFLPAFFGRMKTLIKNRFTSPINFSRPLDLLTSA